VGTFGLALAVNLLIESDINKKPSGKAGFFGVTKCFVYSEIELETFCFESSGLSMQPDKPTIINAIAKSAKIFFINISSKGGLNYFIYCAPIYKKHRQFIS